MNEFSWRNCLAKSRLKKLVVSFCIQHVNDYINYSEH